jgi:Flp pilus assembly protein TadB
VSYPVKLGLAAIAIFLVGVGVVIIFDKLWLQVSLGAAIVVVGGALLALAWWVDRKDKRKREGLDELPDV